MNYILILHALGFWPNRIMRYTLNASSTFSCLARPLMVAQFCDPWNV
jgi:hypothetical protein